MSIDGVVGGPRMRVGVYPIMLVLLFPFSMGIPQNPFPLHEFRMEYPQLRGKELLQFEKRSLRGSVE